MSKGLSYSIFYRACGAPAPTKSVRLTFIIFYIRRVSLRAATAAICDNLPLLPLGNCIREHISTGITWNITFVSARFVWRVADSAFVCNAAINRINENCFKWSPFTPLQCSYAEQSQVYDLVWIIILHGARFFVSWTRATFILHNKWN